jgi:hypothetical protein
VTCEDLPLIPKADKGILQFLVLVLEGFLFSYPLMSVLLKSQLCGQSGLVYIFKGSS